MERIDFLLRLDRGLAADDILAGEDRLAGSNVRLGVDADTKELNAASAAFGEGGIHTQWPKIIVKLFIGLSLPASSSRGKKAAIAVWRYAIRPHGESV